MAITISYQNQFEEPVTDEQAQSLKIFYKVFTVDGLIKQEQQYSGDVLRQVIYYLDEKETAEQAIATILQAYQLQDGFTLRKREQYGIYKKETSKFYLSSGEYGDFMETCLFDDKHRLIYEKSAHTFKGVYEAEVRKYFYNEVNEEFELLYDNEGQLLCMKGMQTPFVPENDHLVSVKDFPMFFPNFLRDNPYYTNANP